MAARATAEGLVARYTDLCYGIRQVYPSAERPLPDDKEINLEYLCNQCPLVPVHLDSYAMIVLSSFMALTDTLKGPLHTQKLSCTGPRTSFPRRSLLLVC